MSVATAASLRAAIDDGLNAIERSEATVAWRFGSFSVRLVGRSEGAVLECLIPVSPGKLMGDVMFRRLLGLALASAGHFDGVVNIDRHRSLVTLMRRLPGLSQQQVWYACEQLINQADVWIDVVARQMLQPAAGEAAPLPRAALRV